MFELDYSRPFPPRQVNESAIKFASTWPWSDVEFVLFTRWEEHCLECSPPSCFRTCPLHVPRQDRMCARFEYGIRANSAYEGLFDFGADITFRRWGKLEAKITGIAITPESMRELCQRDLRVLRVLSPLSELYNSVVPFRKINLNIMYNRLRASYLRRELTSHGIKDVSFDDLVVEIHNPAAERVTLFLEVVDRSRCYFKTALTLEPGQNVQRLPYASLRIPTTIEADGPIRMKLYPENDLEARVIVTWLYAVKWRAGMAEKLSRQPSPKVKCVVWDLDGTLWDGVLVKDGPEAIRPREGVIELVEQLDRRGVLQSIASKNDHEAAWDLLGEFQLQQYFLYPAIHWGPKSESIRQLAEELNIDLNTVALIDDSAFERDEVTAHFTQVRAYDTIDVDRLLELSEFDFPVTAESARRREMYGQEVQRKRVASDFDGQYEEFLRTCGLCVTVFTPQTKNEVVRCVELVQRTNQLNTSGNRYERSEIEALLAD